MERETASFWPRRQRDLLKWRTRPPRPDGRLAHSLYAAHRFGSRQKMWLRSLVSFARLRPNFLVIGERKCGSSALYAYLLQHPGALGYWNKEAKYFDRFYARGESWYLAHFPLAVHARPIRRRLGIEPAVGEATPGYLFHPEAPARARAFRSDLRLIVVLRDPVTRVYSEFRMDAALGLTGGISFEQAIEESLEREQMVDHPAYPFPSGRYSMIVRGRYLESLQRWLEHFPREQLLVLTTEELATDPAGVVRGVAEFVGLPAWAPSGFERVNARPETTIADETRAFLEQYYEEPNRRLYEFLGRDLGWSRPAAAPQRSLA